MTITALLKKNWNWGSCFSSAAAQRRLQSMASKAPLMCAQVAEIPILVVSPSPSQSDPGWLPFQGKVNYRSEECHETTTTIETSVILVLLREPWMPTRGMEIWGNQEADKIPSGEKYLLVSCLQLTGSSWQLWRVFLPEMRGQMKVCQNSQHSGGILSPEFRTLPEPLSMHQLSLDVYLHGPVAPSKWPDSPSGTDQIKGLRRNLHTFINQRSLHSTDCLKSSTRHDPSIFKA